MNAVSQLSAAAPRPTAPPVTIEPALITVDGARLDADWVMGKEVRGVVLFSVGTGCIAESAHTGELAERLAARGLATLRFALLTAAEAEKDVHTGYWSFDLHLLTRRMIAVTQWARQQPVAAGVGLGYFATSTGAAAALVAAGQLGTTVQAVVCRAGRPDFAGDALAQVAAPTLLIVGELDEGVLTLNQLAFARLPGRKAIVTIPQAGHLFGESDALGRVGDLAAEWFEQHLTRPGARSLS